MDVSVQDLLDFSSPRELGMQSGSINALLEKALRFVVVRRYDATLARRYNFSWMEAEASKVRQATYP